MKFPAAYSGSSADASCVGIIAAALAIAALASSPSRAEESQAWKWCVNNEKASPDLQISGCTTVIQSGRETTKNIAIAFNNRGNAFHDKKEYDRAISDYDQAIKLDPKYARALYNRGISTRRARSAVEISMSGSTSGTGCWETNSSGRVSG